MLQVSGNTLQKVEKFKYIEVVFKGEGRRNTEIDIRIDKANTVLPVLYRFGDIIQESPNTAKLSVFKYVFVPILSSNPVWSSNKPAGQMRNGLPVTKFSSQFCDTDRQCRFCWLAVTLVQLNARVSRYPVTLLEVIKTGAIRTPFNYPVIKFLPKLPKTLKVGRHMLQLWQLIPNKILYRLPKITKQLLTFQPRQQASIFQYWLTASQSPLLMRTTHPLL